MTQRHEEDFVGMDDFLAPRTSTDTPAGPAAGGGPDAGSEAGALAEGDTLGWAPEPVEEPIPDLVPESAATDDLEASEAPDAAGSPAAETAAAAAADGGHTATTDETTQAMLSPASTTEDQTETPGATSSAAAAREGGHRGERHPETAEALTRERLLPKRSRIPESGWRLALYRLSFGLINVGDSADTLERQDLDTRVAARLTTSTRSVAVLSRKGGVGKTTTATLIGKTLAAKRHDRVVAIDANPDAGTLIMRTDRQTPATVWDVAESRESVTSFSDMSRLVSRDSTRLDVIASEDDAHRARAFGATEYEQVTELLSQYYSITVTDTGTDFTHQVLGAVLAKANVIVVVAGTKLDESQKASQTLDIVEASGYPELARTAVVALVESDKTEVDVDEVRRHFESKAGAVVWVPRDPHIGEGSLIDLDRLNKPTRRAGLKLAASVVDRIRDPHHWTSVGQ